MLLIMLCVLAVLCCIGIRPRRETDGDALCQNQTTALRGIFAVIILYSHMRQYVAFDLPIDAIPIKLMNFIGQLMVTFFLFCSGYGVAVGYDRKTDYAKFFPRNRIFKTWYHFAAAIVLYVLCGFALGTRYPVRRILLSLVGWSAVGNSNWYVFDTLVLYLLTFAAFCLTRWIFKKKNPYAVGAFITLFSFLMILILRSVRDSWWVDTVMCYAFGWWFYLIKDSFFAVLRRRAVYYPVLAAVAALFWLYHSRYGNLYEYNICACLFVLLLILVTYKVKIANPVLNWLGRHAFQIYILMRLPMNVLTHFGLNRNVPLFCGISVAATMLISFAALPAEKVMDRVLLRQGRKQ